MKILYRVSIAATIIAALLVGCSSPTIVVRPEPTKEQTAIFEKGAATLVSKATESIVALSSPGFGGRFYLIKLNIAIANLSDRAFNIGESDVSVVGSSGMLTGAPLSSQEAAQKINNQGPGAFGSLALTMLASAPGVISKNPAEVQSSTSKVGQSISNAESTVAQRSQTLSNNYFSLTTVFPGEQFSGTVILKLDTTTGSKLSFQDLVEQTIDVKVSSPSEEHIFRIRFPRIN